MNDIFYEIICFVTLLDHFDVLLHVLYCFGSLVNHSTTVALPGYGWWFMSLCWCCYIGTGPRSSWDAAVTTCYLILGVLGWDSKTPCPWISVVCSLVLGLSKNCSGVFPGSWTVLWCYYEPLNPHANVFCALLYIFMSFENLWHMLMLFETMWYFMGFYTGMSIFCDISVCLLFFPLSTAFKYSMVHLAHYGRAFMLSTELLKLIPRFFILFSIRCIFWELASHSSAPRFPPDSFAHIW